MRHVIHLAVDADRADVRLRRERRHDAARMVEIGVRGRETCIDGCDLIRVDCDPAEKSIPSRDLATFSKPFLIPEINVERLERRSTSRTRSPRPAPSAMRTPISRVRRSTANDSMP